MRAVHLGGAQEEEEEEEGLFEESLGPRARPRYPGVEDEFQEEEEDEASLDSGLLLIITLMRVAFIFLLYKGL